MGDVSGLGFVFTDGDPIVGVDLDDCRIPETGKTREWATDIIDRLDSFTERSPSGTGYHVLVEGSLPDGRNRKGDIELYETARFFTVTGEHVADTPSSVELRDDALDAVHREYLREEDAPSAAGSDDERAVIDRSDTDATPGSSLSDASLIERAKEAANGEKFTRLWRGSTAGYESQSEADMALCSLLAFWSGGDASQMHRLFRESGLIRDKWDEQHFADGSSYGEKTIERAIAGTDEFYELSTSSETEAQRVDMNAAPGPVDPSLQTGQRREAEHIERIEELTSNLQEALDTIDQMEADLRAERKRRRELQAELDTEPAGTRWWLPW